MRSWRVTIATVTVGCLGAFAVLSAASSSSGTDAAPRALDTFGVSYGPLPEQVLDVHLPARSVGPVAVVVFAHSGGWISGTRAAIPDLIQALGPDGGVAVVSIDYRVIGTRPDGSYTNTFPSASYDMDRAIRFVRANAPQWDLDPNRIIAAGASAGGQLAALAGAAPGAFTDPDLPPDLARVSPVVQGVIDYVGPSDFRTFPEAGGWAPALTAGLLDCKPAKPETCDPARVTAATVATHLTPSAPPAYLAYGGQDSLVLPATQGLPLATAWAQARGDFDQPDPQRRGVWYEDQANTNHNFDRANSDYAAMRRWVQLVLDGSLR